MVEPAVGVERLFFMFFTDAYDEETLENGETRVIMHFNPILAPVKAAILPLNKDYNDLAEEIRKDFSQYFETVKDLSGSIGKRYRRQDEVGTPFCITIDEQSIIDQTYTIRDRDTMQQERLTLEEIKKKIIEAIKF